MAIAAGRELRRARSAALLMVAEGLLVVGALVAAHALRFGGVELSQLVEGGILQRALLFAVVTVVCLYYWDCYDPYVARSVPGAALVLLQAMATVAVVLAVVAYSLPPLAIGRGVLLLGILLSVGVLLVWRLSLAVARRAGDFQEKVLIIGASPVARRLAREILSRPQLGLRIEGFIDDDPALQGVSIVNPSVIGTTADLPAVAQEYGIQRVIVALNERRGRLPMETLLGLRVRGVGVHDAATFYEAMTGKILIEDLRPSWIVFSDGFRPSRATLLTKRAVELAVAAIGLVVTAPVMLLVAVLVKLDSPGPLLFAQERVGQDEKLFTLYKFRSMRADAEAATGPVWATARDPRVTRVGRWIRKLRLDELPQLWNVVRGDMGFVGPRPERPHFVERLKKEIPYYSQRHVVRPGLTGWAQVRYPYGSTAADAMEKLQYELFYIKNMSLALDVAIVLRTIKVVLLGRGAL
jgi:sugar transferase (PEP-CTERM system associated)